MNIVGLDTLVFGVDDVAACKQYMTDYGLNPMELSDAGGQFEARDGTSVIIRHKDDPSLPAPLSSSCMLRKTVYGVADQKTLLDIESELSKDRDVLKLDNGSIECTDDMGFSLGFQITIRRKIDHPGEKINCPDLDAQRAPNIIGADEEAEITPRSLSHVVYFVPDGAKAEAFYTERLGFRVVDRFSNLGPFLRPAGTLDHHALFLIHTPPEMQGVEHFTFHMSGPTELLLAGKRFQEKGYVSFWGPGRHIFGSNWFWYFNSPMNVHVEYDADMDLHDDSWIPREVDASADSSQIFNFTLVDKWMPGG